MTMLKFISAPTAVATVVGATANAGDAGQFNRMRELKLREQAVLECGELRTPVKSCYSCFMSTPVFASARIAMRSISQSSHAVWMPIAALWAVAMIALALSATPLKAGTFPAVINLSSLDGNNGFRILGAARGEASGWSVAAAGDMNHDGFDDVIIGDLGTRNGQGSSYVVFGKRSRFPAVFDLGNLNGSNGFWVNGAGTNETSVAGAGDVNHDGFSDVIIGAPRQSRSYVVFGRASGFPARFDVSSLTGKNGFRLDGASCCDLTGWSVAGAGDINGDGFSDLIVGANGFDTSKQAAGAAYVVFGKASGFSSTINLSKLHGSDGFRIDGVIAHGEAGRSVASAGDVNVDGFPDVVVGAPFSRSNGVRFSGESYVVFGKAAGFPAVLSLGSLDGLNGFRLNGTMRPDSAGYSVAGGDINGDGFADVIVGAYGKAFVVFGRASGFPADINLGSLDGTKGFRLTGIPVGRYLTSSVASAGDVNGDGLSDMIVGAPQADPHGANSGSTYVVFGKASGFPASFDLSTLDGTNGFRLDSVAPGDWSGDSVSGAGDINGDGATDIIIGAARYGDSSRPLGSSYVVFGRP